MYLKSLTLRGFKSFASATTLRLETGITCVVGPNGSGKSNVVDALSWVMGEQGAKSLRGGKMEDVIFAGTTSRAPLGRAEVSLTIDNTDGALPIDYAEVTISRLMFRSGQSEYSINGDSCRLLDVQDLLSDSGLGREMHVIVGQGQLDQILHAGPEARRAIIEEAAGVLKHRKRKEKALRKLEAMQANLTRLVDLTAELNRRLKPLGRQAEVARRAATIQADLRDARLRLLADDYLALRDKLEREVADEAAILSRRAILEASLAQARQQEAELDAAVATQAAELAQAQQTWFALSSLTERLRSVAGLANERARLLAADAEPERPGRDPDELDRQAEELRAEEAALTERMEEGRDALALAVAERTAVEGGLAHAERRLADAARAAAGRAERLARLRGMVDASRSRGAATGEEIDRLTAAAEQARARAERAQLEYSEVQDVADGGDSDRSGLAAELDQATKDHNHHSERTVASRKAERAANSEVAALRARVDALKETLRRGVDATAAVLADPDRFRGVLGSFAAQLTVADGYQKAIAAALGAAAEALTVNGLDAAVEVLTDIRTANAGTVGLVIASPPPNTSDSPPPIGPPATPPIGPPATPPIGPPATPPIGPPATPPIGPPATPPIGPGGPRGHLEGSRGPQGHIAGPAATPGGGPNGHANPNSPSEPPGPSSPILPADRSRPTLPAGAGWAVDLVSGPPELAGAVGELLANVVVVQDLSESARFIRDNPDCRCVTADGDLIGAHWAHGGSAGAQSLLDVRAAADDAAAKLAAAEMASEAAADTLAEATEATDEARQVLEEIRGRLRAADAATAEISGRLGRLAGAARAAADEAKRLDAAVGAAQRSAEKDLAKLAQLKAELAEAEADEDRARDPEVENQQADEERAELTQRAASAREAEMEARLEVRTVEERLRAISGRADSLAASATAERAARERAAIRRRQRAAQGSVARAVAAGATAAVSAAESSLAESNARRTAAETATAAASGTLKTVRAQATAVSAELDAVVNTAHGTEISRNEHRLRLEQLASHATDEYGVEPDALIAEYGPDVLILVPAGSPLAITARKRGTAVAQTPAASATPDVTDPADISVAADAVDAAADDAPSSLADALRAVRTEAEESEAASPARKSRAAEAEAEAEPETVGVPYVRAEQEERAAEADRQLTRLGKVNPLALEEYEALVERHQFLATQLDDLRKTRRDLLTVVKEVDDRVQEVFASAYADTAREFEGLFARLFPGGAGRLILTEPDDMLTTGIEIEARPPGKKVKRLSLLSGGERSLTAIAYLFAIFKARPSPFYVLDEVEAALDDSNLQRLLGVFGELQESSQLIVITHQRRTMEAADSLYGVSMRGDGVSTVISQRVRESEPA